MALPLATGNTISGVAGSAAAVTYTIFGDEVTATGDAFKVLAQGQLPSSIGTLYTVPAATQALVQHVALVNTTGATVTAELAVNGTAAANEILPSVGILAGGFAVYSGDRWTVYNSQGQALGVGATGATGSPGIGYDGLASTTSTTIGTGSLTFTTNLDAAATAFAVGDRVRVAYPTTPSDFMEGIVTAFAGTSLTVNVDFVGGSGTFASWAFAIAGQPGNMTNPMTTSQDIIVGGVVGAPGRLGVGADGTFLGPSGGTLGYQTSPKGLPLGLAGATAATRYVGATTSGAPVSGTFAVGDFIIDQSGSGWICTVAGSPGTWTQIAGGGGAISAVVSAAALVTAYTTYR